MLMTTFRDLANSAQGENMMNGTLLLVIPPVVRVVNGGYEVEVDFSHNLRAYLANFSHVTFACSALSVEKAAGIILRSLPLEEVQNKERLSYIPLPYAYREDRYLRHYFQTRRLLRSEIAKATHLLFSPYAKYDWPTLAAKQAIKMKRKYDLEADVDYPSLQRFGLASMPPGLKKTRRMMWMRSFSKAFEECLRHSSISLLQGQDVFNAFKDVAPNPHKVLNVQVSSEDHISPDRLNEKVAHIGQHKSLTIAYAGQMIARKGPIDWLKAVQGAVEAGVDLRATWFGSGPLMPEMRQEVERRKIDKFVTFGGNVSREEIMANLQRTDIFLFCHKTAESPRCLGEALACGCALVGYGTAYPRELVASHGGGEFAKMDNWQELASIIASLAQHRPKLARQVREAAASGKLLDREAAMQNRIDLIKKYGNIADTPRFHGSAR